MSYPISLCAGLDLRVCGTCKRNADRYTAEELAANPARIRPAADPPRCADWMAAPRAAFDSTHERL